MLNNYSVRYEKRTRTVPVRVSQREEEFLKAEGKRQGVPVAELIRKGYISKFSEMMKELIWQK